jgi:hypothetical protein
LTALTLTTSTTCITLTTKTPTPTTTTTTTTSGTKREDEITSGYLMRRTAVDFGVGLITNVKCAALLVDSLMRQKDDVIRHRPPVCLEEYYGSSNKEAM